MHYFTHILNFQKIKIHYFYLLRHKYTNKPKIIEVLYPFMTFFVVTLEKFNFQLLSTLMTLLNCQLLSSFFYTKTLEIIFHNFVYQHRNDSPIKPIQINREQATRIRHQKNYQDFFLQQPALRTNRRSIFKSKQEVFSRKPAKNKKISSIGVDY